MARVSHIVGDSRVLQRPLYSASPTWLQRRVLMWTGRGPAQPFPHSLARTGLLPGTAPVLFRALVFVLKEVFLWKRGAP